MKKSFIKNLIIIGTIIFTLGGLVSCKPVPKDQLDEKIVEFIEKDKSFKDYEVRAYLGDDNVLTITLLNDVYESNELDANELESLVIDSCKDAKKLLDKSYSKEQIDLVVQVILRGNLFIKVKNGYIDFLDKDAISKYNLDFNENMGGNNVVNNAKLIVGNNTLLNRSEYYFEYFEADNALYLRSTLNDSTVTVEEYKEAMLDVCNKIKDKIDSIMNSPMNIYVIGNLNDEYSATIYNGEIQMEEDNTKLEEKAYNNENEDYSSKESYNNSYAGQKNVIDLTQIDKTMKERWDRISSLSINELSPNYATDQTLKYMWNSDVDGIVEGIHYGTNGYCSNYCNTDGGRYIDREPIGDLLNKIEYGSNDDDLLRLVEDSLFNGDGLFGHINGSIDEGGKAIRYEIYMDDRGWTFSNKEYLSAVFSVISNVLYEETLTDLDVDVNVYVDFILTNAYNDGDDDFHNEIAMDLLNGNNCIYSNMDLFCFYEN